LVEEFSSYISRGANDVPLKAERNDREAEGCKGMFRWWEKMDARRRLLAGISKPGPWDTER